MDGTPLTLVMGEYTYKNRTVETFIPRKKEKKKKTFYL